MKILIAGGGLGGIAAAVALTRKGHGVTVLEQAPELKEVGAGLQIWAQGPLVLEHLGMQQINQDLACPMSVQNIYTQQGKRLASAAIGKIDAHCGASSYFAHRAEFLDGLVNHAKDAEIRCDARVDSFQASENGVEVTLRGGEVLDGDLLIGADGIHSAVRNQMGAKTAVRYAGFVAWRGIASFDEGSWTHSSPHWGVYLGRGVQLGVFPISNQRAYWFMTENRKEPRTDAEEARAAIRSQANSWPEILSTVLERTPTLIASPIFDLKPFRGWSQGRVTLLGDACHGMIPCLGQGACMALEDAYVLGETLGTSGRLSEDLSRYEALRFRRTRKALRMARTMGRVFQAEGAVMHGVRRWVLPLASRRDPIKAMKWLFNPPVPGSAERIRSEEPGTA